MSRSWTITGDIFTRLFWSLMSANYNTAGFAIAKRITARVRGLNMATKNVNDGLSTLALI